VKIDHLTIKENLFNQTLSEALAERLHPPAGQPPTRAWCAWLPCSNEANHPIAHQASALGRYACSVYTPSGPKGFRFYDPRIAPYLPAILTPAQFGAVFRGIAEHWHYMDEAGQFGQLPAAAPPDTETTATPVYLQFNAQQNQSLTIIGQVNYILQLIPGWDIVAPEKHHDIMQIVQRCHGWGISDDNGVSIFVHCALTKHRLFDTHPDVVKVLSQQKAAFLDWCAACQDEDWLTIIEQLNSKTHETYGNKR
jgi:hypothetical protein